MKRACRFFVVKSCSILCLFLGLFACQRENLLREERPVNHAVIAGLDSVYSVAPGETLHIKPKVQFTLDDRADTSRYRYEWYYWRMVGFINIDADYKVIASGPELEYTVPPYQGTFDLLFRITDLMTGLFSEKEIRIVVRNAIYEGWMVLTEYSNGSPQLDMLSYHADRDSFELLKSVLNYFQPQARLAGKPRFVDFTITSMYELHLGGLVVGTTAGINAYEGEKLAFAGRFDEQLPTGSPVNLAGKVNYDGRFFSAFFNIDGQLFISQNGQSSIDPIFRKVDHVQHINGILDPIKPAPFIGVTKNFPIYQTTVVFDELSKELLWFNSRNSYCHRFGPGELFSYQTGKDLLYLGYTEKDGGQFAALLSDAYTGEIYLARFSMYRQLSYQRIDAPMVSIAEHFALNPSDGTLFFSSGDRLYAIDEPNRSSRVIKDFQGRHISKIKFNTFLNVIPTDHPHLGSTASHDRYMTLQDQLIVCTHDPARPDDSGAFMLFDIDFGRWTAYERFRYDGFSRIIDVAYKER